MKIETQILEQEIIVDFSQTGNFYTVETMGKIILPDDLETGKAIEEVFTSLKEALIKEHNLVEEEYIFFPEPSLEIGYFLSAINKMLLPPEVAAYPESYWYDHSDEVWRNVF